MSVEYNRVNWQQAPSEATPINARNLNNMDKGIDDVVALANANKKGIEELKTTAKQINSNLNKFHKIDNTLNVGQLIGTWGADNLYRIHKQFTVTPTADTWMTIAHGIANAKAVRIDETLSAVIISADNSVQKVNNMFFSTYADATNIRFRETATSQTITFDLYLLYTLT